MMSESPGVPFRAGFDHATSPELVGASFDGWSRLRAGRTTEEKDDD